MAKKDKTNKPDTVRKRKKAQQAAVQRFVPIAEIRNDTALLKSGGLRAVLNVEALNFNLKSEDEQKGIISGYQSFLNTLSFPVQIIVQSRKVDIDPYIQQIKELEEKQQNDLLREQVRNYVNFVEKIVEVADIMTKKFLVVVPLDDTPDKVSGLTKLFRFFGIDDSAAKAVQRYRSFAAKHTRLKERVSLVESGLTNIGLVTKRLETKELIELYYGIYNPDAAKRQKLPKDGELNTSELNL